MTRFLARRAAMAVLTLLAVIVLTFALVHSIPGSPGAVMLGPGASAQEIHAQNELLGWNQPLAVQFWDWITHAVRGDLGTSLTGGNEVGPDLASRLPVTAAIALGATVLSGVLGIVSGVVAAVRGGLVDRFITAFSGIVVSLPTFWLGILLVYVASIRLGWLPATGYTPFADSPVDWAKSLALPVLSLAIGGAALVARQARASMVEALGQEHIRTLRATGIAPWRLLYVHALRNASVPVVAGLGMQFVGLFGSTVIVEQIFALPGLGQVAQAAVTSHDFPSVQGVVIIATVVVVVTNVALDVLISALNPKLRAA
ncbi:ABC transporter permease [Streptomyces pseudovenezuelae]|uniref:ABC transporter permease n=1 Tax=Streptomyces pseudovenezuelae TaxID=67350 RepID=UPI003717EABA